MRIMTGQAISVAYREMRFAYPKPPFLLLVALIAKSSALLVDKIRVGCAMGIVAAQTVLFPEGIMLKCFLSLGSMTFGVCAAGILHERRENILLATLTRMTAFASFEAMASGMKKQGHRVLRCRRFHGGLAIDRSLLQDVASGIEEDYVILPVA